jgi:hypothetical protein
MQDHHHRRGLAVKLEGQRQRRPGRATVVAAREARGAVQPAGPQFHPRRRASPAGVIRHHGAADEPLRASGVLYGLAAEHGHAQRLHAALDRPGRQLLGPSQGLPDQHGRRARRRRRRAVGRRPRRPGLRRDRAEALSHAEACQKLAAALGRPVRCVPVDDETVRPTTLSAGLNRWMADVLIEPYQDYRRSGTDGYAAQVSDTVRARRIRLLRRVPAQPKIHHLPTARRARPVVHRASRRRPGLLTMRSSSPAAGARCTCSTTTPGCMTWQCAAMSPARSPLYGLPRHVHGTTPNRPKGIVVTDFRRHLPPAAGAGGLDVMRS